MILTDFEARNIYAALNATTKDELVGLRHLKLPFELRHILSKINLGLKELFEATEETLKSIKADYSIEAKDGMGVSVKILDPFKEAEFEKCVLDLFKGSKGEYNLPLIPASLLKNVELYLWQEEALEKLIDLDK